MSRDSVYIDLRQRYFASMIIRSVRHKGLRRLLEDDDSSGLPAAVTSKIGDILAFLLAIEGEDELRILKSWKAHLMTGDRAGTWALYVTRNWRITFRIDPREGEITHLDYEDYH